MLLLEHKKRIHGIKVLSLPSYAIKKRKLDNAIKASIIPPSTQISHTPLKKTLTRGTNKLKLQQKTQDGLQLHTKISDPKLLELELTPHAKRFIKSLLSPIAVISYILQESSVGLNKMLTASTSFFMFTLLNCFTSASFGSYEVKLPLISICLFGSILGAKKMVKALKKIILSVPTGITLCSQNITCKDCSIFEFICGIDKRNKSLIKRLFNRS